MLYRGVIVLPSAGVENAGPAVIVGDTIGGLVGLPAQGAVGGDARSLA